MGKIITRIAAAIAGLGAAMFGKKVTAVETKTEPGSGNAGRYRSAPTKSAEQFGVERRLRMHHNAVIMAYHAKRSLANRGVGHHTTSGIPAAFFA